MKTTHAVWEKRNIGSNAYEIIIEKEDSFSDAIKEIESCDGDYIVVKIPVGMSDFMLKIAKYDYSFVETAVSCYYDTCRSFNICDKISGLLEQSRYEKMKQEDLEFLYKNLDNGLYSTDRIALDPFYSVKIANNRYCGWIKDEIKRGSQLYKAICQNNVFGFFGLKKMGDTKYFGFLNGVYKNYQGKGFGTVLHCLQIQAARALGAEKVLSAFSSNNFGAFSVHMGLGYKLDKVEYVYVKHKIGGTT